MFHLHIYKRKMNKKLVYLLKADTRTVNKKGQRILNFTLSSIFTRCRRWWLSAKGCRECGGSFRDVVGQFGDVVAHWGCGGSVG
jgi:hypothetical protein